MLPLLAMPAAEAAAQVRPEWRARLFSRLQYVEARPLALDSVAASLTTGSGQQRTFGGIPVRCAPGESFCYFYRTAGETSTTPLVQDLNVNVWGFGIEGLRFHTNARLRTAFGSGEFWPRTDDHFDVTAAYLELARSRYRIRVGRDYQTSGLGYYGYDGASVKVRLPWLGAEAEAYGGWGLERGLPEPATSDALSSLEEFQQRDRSYLFGFRAGVRPVPGAWLEAIYQREIETDRSGIISERAAFDGMYAFNDRVWVRGNADYDLATGWWGKASASVSWQVMPEVYVQGRVFRYRPVFSLNTIWAAFSPTPYTGYGATIGLRPRPNLSLDLNGERRDWGETDARVPFQATTDRTWRASATARWQPIEQVDVEAGYELNFSMGATLSAGNGRIGYYPVEHLSLGVRMSAFQQLSEFRVGEGRVWSIGGDARWDAPFATIFGSIDQYKHDRRDEGPAVPDWTQLRASLGLSFYLGSEPGRIVR